MAWLIFFFFIYRKCKRQRVKGEIKVGHVGKKIRPLSLSLSFRTWDQVKFNWIVKSPTGPFVSRVTEDVALLLQ